MCMRRKRNVFAVTRADAVDECRTTIHRLAYTQTSKGGVPGATARSLGKNPAEAGAAGQAGTWHLRELA